MKYPKTNFSDHEFACKGEDCCDHSAPMSSMLIYILQCIREEVDSPMIPTCGFRCQKHNANLEWPSNRSSKHCLGIAADFPAPEGFTLKKFYDICDEILRKNLQSGGGLAMYPDRGIVHIDVRPDTCWRKENAG